MAAGSLAEATIVDDDSGNEESDTPSYQSSMVRQDECYNLNKVFAAIFEAIGTACCIIEEEESSDHFAVDEALASSVESLLKEQPLYTLMKHQALVVSSQPQHSLTLLWKKIHEKELAEQGVQEQLREAERVIERLKQRDPPSSGEQEEHDLSGATVAAAADIDTTVAAPLSFAEDRQEGREQLPEASEDNTHSSTQQRQDLEEDEDENNVTLIVPEGDGLEATLLPSETTRQSPTRGDSPGDIEEVDKPLATFSPPSHQQQNDLGEDSLGTNHGSSPSKGGGGGLKIIHPATAADRSAAAAAGIATGGATITSENSLSTHPTPPPGGGGLSPAVSPFPLSTPEVSFLKKSGKSYEATHTLQHKLTALYEEMNMTPEKNKTCKYFTKIFEGRAKRGDKSELDDITKHQITRELQKLANHKNSIVKVLSCIRNREEAVESLQDFVHQFEDQPKFFHAGFCEQTIEQHLNALRERSIIVVEAINTWRTSVGDPHQAFMYNGVSYISKMQHDLMFLLESGLSKFVVLDLNNNVNLAPRRREIETKLTEDEMRERNFFARMSVPMHTTPVPRAAGNRSGDIVQLQVSAEKQRGKNPFFHNATAEVVKVEASPIRHKDPSAGNAAVVGGGFNAAQRRGSKGGSVPVGPIALAKTGVFGPHQSMYGQNPFANNVNDETPTTTPKPFSKDINKENSGAAGSRGSRRPTSANTGMTKEQKKEQLRQQDLHATRLYRRNPLSRFMEVSAPVKVLPSQGSAARRKSMRPRRVSIGQAIRQHGIGGFSGEAGGSAGGSRRQSLSDYPVGSITITRSEDGNTEGANSNQENEDAYGMRVSSIESRGKYWWAVTYYICILLNARTRLVRLVRRKIAARKIQRWARRCHLVNKYHDAFATSVRPTSALLKSSAEAEESWMTENSRRKMEQKKCRGGIFYELAVLYPKAKAAVQFIKQQFRLFRLRTAAVARLRFLKRILQIQIWFRHRVKATQLKKLLKHRHAARKFVRFYRQRIERRFQLNTFAQNRARVKIQRWVRCVYAKRKLAELHERREAAILIQRNTRKSLARMFTTKVRYLAQVKRHVYNHLTRPVYHANLIMSNARKTLFYAMLCWTARKKLAALKERRKFELRVFLRIQADTVYRRAVTKIVSCYQGYKNRVKRQMDYENATRIMYFSEGERLARKALHHASTSTTKSQSADIVARNHLLEEQLMREYLPYIQKLQCFFRVSIAKSVLRRLVAERRKLNIYFHGWKVGTRVLRNYHHMKAEPAKKRFLLLLEERRSRFERERREAEAEAQHQLARQNAAATSIQAGWRRYITREAYLDAIPEYRKIQQDEKYRLHIQRQKESVQIIAYYMKQYRKRRVCERATRQCSSMKIQAQWKRFLSRRQAAIEAHDQLRLEVLSALKIQLAWKIYVDVRDAERQAQRELEEEAKRKKEDSARRRRWENY